MILFAATALSVAVSRARAVFFAQVEADVARQRESALRERVSDLLGKFLPEEIAQKLIDESKPLGPQPTRGTGRVMDIAGFANFSTRHDPEHVVDVLNGFLAEATQSVW
jgi:class 3 adenylate cyclase